MLWRKLRRQKEKGKKVSLVNDNKEVLGKENVNVHSGTSVVYDIHIKVNL